MDCISQSQGNEMIGFSTAGIVLSTEVSQCHFQACKSSGSLRPYRNIIPVNDMNCCSTSLYRCISRPFTSAVLKSNEFLGYRLVHAEHRCRQQIAAYNLAQQALQQSTSISISWIAIARASIAKSGDREGISFRLQSAS